MNLNVSPNFENIGVIATQKNVIEAQLDLMVQKEIKKDIEILKQALPAIQLQIRREVFQSFKMITGIIIEQEFVKYYGHGFNLSSLQKSLIYIMKPNDFEPDIDYNPNVFRFNDKFYQEQNKFNQNARRWERKNRKYIDPGFYTDTGDGSNFYDEVTVEDYFDYTGEEANDFEQDYMDFDNFVFNSKKNPFENINLASVYNKAIQKAKQGFNTEWLKSIKPRLERKYNVKLT